MNIIKIITSIKMDNTNFNVNINFDWKVLVLRYVTTFRK